MCEDNPGEDLTLALGWYLFSRIEKTVSGAEFMTRFGKPSVLCLFKNSEHTKVFLSAFVVAGAAVTLPVLFATSMMIIVEDTYF